jgi:hypothetical protein
MSCVQKVVGTGEQTPSINPELQTQGTPGAQSEAELQVRKHTSRLACVS